MAKPFNVGDPVVFQHPRVTAGEPIHGVVDRTLPGATYSVDVDFSDFGYRSFTSTGYWSTADTQPTLRHAEDKPQWTVVLLYPDYMCDSNDHETYIALVAADTFDEALGLAKQQAADTNQSLESMEEDGPPSPTPDDFYCIAAVQGNHPIWSEELACQVQPEK